jgi:Ser/Thr protein kinase RdoA (MazF antagonist)
MDVKNVLWQGSDPVIIDLECLELGNPVNDLVQLALSWAGDVSGGLDETRLTAFLTAYRKVHSLPPMDWSAVCGLGFFWLDWLHYNLRRACGLAADTEEERMLGSRQAQETLVRIRSYAENLPAAAARFRQVFGS